MSATRPVVAVIDDDSQMRAALEGLLETIDIDVKSFARADDFLRSGHLDEVSCIVLDVRLPGPSGFDVQRELAKAKVQAPIIFMTGHGDIPMTVRAMKAGALEFLAKPFRDQDLLDAVRQGIVQDHDRREREKIVTAIGARYETLTARERQIMTYVANGWPNKRIAADTDLSEVTVRLHRSQVMHKMKARSIADLVRMADTLRAASAKDS